jgi:hypothetical protein
MKNFLIAISALVFSMIAHAENTAFASKYACRGSDKTSNDLYDLTLKLVPLGNNYQLQWVDADAAVVSKGFAITHSLFGNRLLVATYQLANADGKNSSGVVTYFVNKKGSLIGEWAAVGSEKTTKEICLPAA